MFKNVWEKIPESVQLGIIILLLFIVPVLLIYLTAEYEGVASILFILGGIAFYRTGQNNPVLKHYGFAIGFIMLFGILGMVFDGAGNFIYNKPIENLCPPQNELVRDVKYVETHDGDDSILHQFSCFSIAENKIVYEIPRWKTLGIRFVEYILLGMIFAGFYWVMSKFTTRTKG